MLKTCLAIVLVVASAITHALPNFREVVETLFSVQATLGREVNPKVYSAIEFSAKATLESFLADVLAKPKIFLIGNAHDLEELAGRQP